MAEHKLVKEIKNKKEFDEMVKEDKLFFVDFYATWCGPCQMMGPIIEEVAEEYKDNQNIVFAKVDVDANPEIASEYAVMSIPTMFFLTKGGEEADKLIGGVGKDQIKNIIEEFLSQKK